MAPQVPTPPISTGIRAPASDDERRSRVSLKMGVLVWGINRKDGFNPILRTWNWHQRWVVTTHWGLIVTKHAVSSFNTSTLKVIVLQSTSSDSTIWTETLNCKTPSNEPRSSQTVWIPVAVVVGQSHVSVNRWKGAGVSFEWKCRNHKFFQPLMRMQEWPGKFRYCAHWKTHTNRQNFCRYSPVAHISC